MIIRQARLRKLHRFFAPIMILPVLLTLVTGSLYQVADLNGKGDKFDWLLEVHKGHFGAVDLQVIYPFLNAFGILSLALTGISIWLQMRALSRRRSDAG